ncbi:hypothetical protein ACOSQ2_028593 [Xanthoceras sorbifolium]
MARQQLRVDRRQRNATIKEQMQVKRLSRKQATIGATQGGSKDVRGFAWVKDHTLISTCVLRLIAVTRLVADISRSYGPFLLQDASLAFQSILVTV